MPLTQKYNLGVTNYNGGKIESIVPDIYYKKESPYALPKINRFGPQTTAFPLEVTQRLTSGLK
ncbi:hypothetical protein GCM10027347_56560 [Larkinella harenae]